jgi:hypothetical protein
MSILALTSDTLIGTAAAGNLEYDGQFFGTDSNASRAQLQRIVRATAVASTSGTSIDFTGIPAWVERITVMFSGVSTNGTSTICIQIGPSGGVETSGYASVYNNLGGGAAGTSTAALGLVTVPVAAYLYNGAATLTLLNASTNSWTLTSQLAAPAGPGLDFGAGSKTLAGVLSRVRVTTLGGVNTFDAGTVNIIYEG